MASHQEIVDSLQMVMNVSKQRIDEVQTGAPIPDDIWFDLAQKLPDGYSFLVTNSIEVGGKIYGAELVQGTVYQWDGVARNVYSLSGTVGIGSWNIGAGTEFHLVKGDASNLRGFALQIEGSGIIGEGITIPFDPFSNGLDDLATYRDAIRGALQNGNLTDALIAAPPWIDDLWSRRT